MVYIENLCAAKFYLLSCEKIYKDPARTDDILLSLMITGLWDLFQNNKISFSYMIKKTGEHEDLFHVREHRIDATKVNMKIKESQSKGLSCMKVLTDYLDNNEDKTVTLSKLIDDFFIADFRPKNQKVLTLQSDMEEYLISKDLIQKSKKKNFLLQRKNMVVSSVAYAEQMEELIAAIHSKHVDEPSSFLIFLLYHNNITIPEIDKKNIKGIVNQFKETSLFYKLWLAGYGYWESIERFLFLLRND